MKREASLPLGWTRSTYLLTQFDEEKQRGTQGKQKGEAEAEGGAKGEAEKREQSATVGDCYPLPYPPRVRPLVSSSVGPPSVCRITHTGYAPPQ